VNRTHLRVPFRARSPQGERAWEAHCSQTIQNLLCRSLTLVLRGFPRLPVRGCTQTGRPAVGGPPQNDGRTGEVIYDEGTPHSPRGKCGGTCRRAGGLRSDIRAPRGSSHRAPASPGCSQHRQACPPPFARRW